MEDDLLKSDGVESDAGMSETLFKNISFDEALQGFSRYPGFENICAFNVIKLLEAQTGWFRLANWEQYSDNEIYQTLVESYLPSGTVAVVTDRSYSDGVGAFEVDSDRVTDFMASYLIRFGECVFNGDTLIVSIGQRAIWAQHHEGMLGTFLFGER